MGFFFLISSATAAAVSDLVAPLGLFALEGEFGGVTKSTISFGEASACSPTDAGSGCSSSQGMLRSMQSDKPRFLRCLWHDL